MRIVLLADEEHFWPLLETYLRNINARDIVTVTAEGIDAALADNPALVISGRKLADVPTVAASRVPLIVIAMANDPPPPPARAARRKTWHLSWPLPKKLFLETTAEALGIEPRREFNSLIRVTQQGVSSSSMARSQNFSESGMAFQSEAFFAVGTKIATSLSLPGQEEGIVLQGRVVRQGEGEDDGGWTYGVEYLVVDPPTRKRLRNFILS